MQARQIASKLVFRNQWLRLREDLVEQPDGRAGSFAVLEKPDFALIVPRDEDGALWMVEQYRYPVRGRYWEFPQGSWEDAPEMDPEKLARAELAEETGLRATEMRHLRFLHEAYGYAMHGFHVWLATGLEPGVPHRDPTEQDMEVGRFSPSEFEQMLEQGRITDAPTVAAYGLLLLSRQTAQA